MARFKAKQVARAKCAERGDKVQSRTERKQADCPSGGAGCKHLFAWADAPNKPRTRIGVCRECGRRRFYTRPKKKSAAG